MPSASALRAMYRRFCKMPVKVRRYTTTAGVRSKVDYPAHGNVRLYAATELVGNIKQGDYRAIILAQDLETAGLPSPVTTTDLVLFGGRELSIQDPGTRAALDGTLVAYDIQARG